MATLAVFWPLGAGAQSLDEEVIQRRLEFQQAEAEHVAARSAFSVVERQFSTALDAVREARRTGSDEVLEQALAQAQARSGPFSASESRVQEARARLDEARQRLIDAIGLRLQQLVVQMEGTLSPQQRADMNVLYRDHESELARLESESEDTFRFELALMADVTFDPRDGPDDLETKAQLVDRQAAQADTVVQDIDQQIETLSERLRVQQQRGDLLAAVGRFDDTNLPVGVTGGPPPADLAADSTGVGNRPMTLEERIEALTDWRAQMASYRDQLIIKAEIFRRRIGAVA